MRFISVRDLRGKSAEVWKSLARERELVVTHNGKPIAILTATDEASFEQSLRAIRQSRALDAARRMHEISQDRGTDGMTMDDVDAEVAAARAAIRRSRCA